MFLDSFVRWLKRQSQRFSGDRRTAAGRKPHSRFLQIEVLEDRVTPAQNILIQTGGMLSVPAGASSFADTTDYFIDPSAFNGVGSVTLQANNQVNFLSDVSLPGSLFVQAGNSITVNGSISTGGTLKLEANDANAAAADRSPGPASLSVAGSSVKLNSNGSSLILQADGSTGSTFPSGGLVVSGGAQLLTTGGDITLNGDNSQGSGVKIGGGAQVIPGGTGQVTIQGNGGNSPTDSNFGVYVTGTSNIGSSGGDVQVTGQFGTVGNTNYNVGVQVDSDSTITAGGTGNVTISGSGGGAGGTDNYGVSVSGLGSTITSNGGQVMVIGIGGGTTTSMSPTGYASNDGVILFEGGMIGTMNAGNQGAVVVKGTGGHRRWGSQHWRAYCLRLGHGIADHLGGRYGPGHRQRRRYQQLRK